MNEVSFLNTAKMNQKKSKNGPVQFFSSILIMIAATGIDWFFQIWNVPETNIVLIYLLAVLLISRFTQGYIYGIAASVIATCLFIFFFAEPIFTFSLYEATYLITFVIMLLTALITSTLTSRVMENADEARKREAEANALYKLTNHLTDAEDIPTIANIAVWTISSTLDCQAACLYYGENGHLEKQYVQQKNAKEQIHPQLEDPAATEKHFSHLHTRYQEGPSYYEWPIYGKESILAVLCIPTETAEHLSETQSQLLQSTIESTALAMDRVRSAQEKMKSREEAEQERYRSNLLRAISHDLRTPLSGIMGTSEMLMDMTEPEDERHAMAEGIYQDADWLYSMVENILSLTRLQEGKLTPKKQLEPIEEIIGVAVAAVEKREKGREITVSIPDTVLMIPVDAKLIEQVLINLLDNARKHTPLDCEICLTVDTDAKNEFAVFTVADRGSGIREEDLPHIFEMFYTTNGKSSDAIQGIGLGLTICKSIVEAHGGTISAQNRTDGPGALFTFTLPLEEQDDD